MKLAFYAWCNRQLEKSNIPLSNGARSSAPEMNADFYAYSARDIFRSSVNDHGTDEETVSDDDSGNDGVGIEFII